MITGYHLDVKPSVSELMKMYELSNSKIRQAISTALKASVEDIKGSILKDPDRPLWQGHYGRLMKTSVNKKTLVGSIGSTARYGKFVEYGGDYSAKYKDILPWVKFKVKQGRITLAPGVSAAMAAFWITRSLNKKGSKPSNYFWPPGVYPYLERTVDKRFPLIAREFNKHIQAAAEEIVKKKGDGGKG